MGFWSARAAHIERYGGEGQSKQRGTSGIASTGEGLLVLKKVLPRGSRSLSKQSLVGCKPVGQTPAALLASQRGVTKLLDLPLPFSVHRLSRPSSPPVSVPAQDLFSKVCGFSSSDCRCLLGPATQNCKYKQRSAPPATRGPIINDSSALSTSPCQRKPSAPLPFGPTAVRAGNSCGAPGPETSNLSLHPTLVVSGPLG